MKILITGVVGFIGFHLSKKLLSLCNNVIGFDNLNDYYDVGLKLSRLEILNKYENFTFVKGAIENKSEINFCFKTYNPNLVIHLAAQAGVRYSITNPDSYIASNLVGFYNILELCKESNQKHLIYASSSSIYGNQTKTPFGEGDMTDFPVSLYAATKKSNELLAYSYSQIYGLNTIGLRFFTVYGSFGRPDMAYFSMCKKIILRESIQIFNNGDLMRDFTYVDDIVDGICKLVDKVVLDIPLKKIYNLGNNKPVKLMDFIEILEHAIGISAKKEYLPMQLGDVYKTYADIGFAKEDFGYSPETNIEKGLQHFVEWYKSYYNITETRYRK